MLARNTLTAALAAAACASALITLPGCAVQRGQETVGAYVDDATITTKVKARMVNDTNVDAGAIKVETLNGTVMLSGFAKSEDERATAERIARGVAGVKEVKDAIVVKPR